MKVYRIKVTGLEEDDYTDPLFPSVFPFEYLLDGIYASKEVAEKHFPEPDKDTYEFKAEVVEQEVIND